ncbi:MAG: glycosyltransferase family 9 protein [Desulfovibrio sp.]|jgi:ADP-heptose:LPS heptosyltransferase|nr:glycosyltransferase family 9 protein [Desulfovibrio sp.]
MAIDTLVVNLTRFGDLIQCQPLLADLRRAGHSTGILCLDNFAAALPMLDGPAASWTLNGGHLLALTDSQWPVALRVLQALTRDIRKNGAPRHVINLTPNLTARLLTGLVAPPGARIHGFGIDADGFSLNGGAWSTFLTGAAMRRVNAPFNLVDMTRMVAKPSWGRAAPLPPREFRLAPPDPGHEERARALLEEAAGDVEGIAGHVGLQLGASKAQRQWPVAAFAELGSGLWATRKLCPVLLGSSQEAPLAAEYARHAQGPFIDAVGATDLQTLAGLLRSLKLLVTNDTGTMHMAAGLGIPCIAFFLASAQVWDTAPYLAGCCCLEPSLPCHPCGFRENCAHTACRGAIEARHVLDLATRWLDTGDWRLPADHPLHRQARVWETVADEDGFANVTPLSGQEREERTQWFLQQRHFWRRILDDLEEESPRRRGEDVPPPPVLSRTFAESVSGTLGAAARLLETLGEERILAERSAAAGQLFLRNCDRLNRLLIDCRHLGSLAHFSRELLQQRADSLEGTIALIGRLATWLHRWSAALA